MVNQKMVLCALLFAAPSAYAMEGDDVYLIPKAAVAGYQQVYPEGMTNVDEAPGVVRFLYDHCSGAQTDFGYVASVAHLAGCSDLPYIVTFGLGFLAAHSEVTQFDMSVILGAIDHSCKPQVDLPLSDLTYVLPEGVGVDHSDFSPYWDGLREQAKKAAYEWEYREVNGMPFSKLYLMARVAKLKRPVSLVIDGATKWHDAICEEVKEAGFSESLEHNLLQRIAGASQPLYSCDEQFSNK